MRHTENRHLKLNLKITTKLALVYEHQGDEKTCATGKFTHYKFKPPKHNKLKSQCYLQIQKMDLTIWWQINSSYCFLCYTFLSCSPGKVHCSKYVRHGQLVHDHLKNDSETGWPLLSKISWSSSMSTDDHFCFCTPKYNQHRTTYFFPHVSASML